MSWLWRILAGLLLGWALFMNLGDPVLTLEVSNGDERLLVECYSLSDRAFGGGYVDTTAAPDTYTLVRGEEPEMDERAANGANVSDQLNDHCDRTRTARAAGIGLLAAPIAIFGLLGFAMPWSEGGLPRGGSPSTERHWSEQRLPRRTEPHWSERTDRPGA